MLQMTDNACKICGSERYSRRLDFRDKKRQVVSCGACGAWRTMPYFSMDYGVQEFYCEHYMKNERLYRGFARDLVDIVFRHRRKGRLLDIGCSVGFLLEEALARGFEAEGMELNERAVEIARSRGLLIKTSSLEAAGYGEDVFDVVVLNHILEHIVELNAFLKGVRKIIRENGILVIGVPNHDSLITRLCGKNWYGWGVPEHVWHFDRKSLRGILSKNGFRTIELIQNSQYYPFSKSLRKNSIGAAARIGNRIGAGDQLIAIAEKA